MFQLITLLVVLTLCTCDPNIPGNTPDVRTIKAGSIIIPMDNTLQTRTDSIFTTSQFNIRTYGLVANLLDRSIPVLWIIKTGKSFGTTDFSGTVQQRTPTT